MGSSVHRSSRVGRPPIGAAITMTGLEIALQTSGATFYDTGYRFRRLPDTSDTCQAPAGVGAMDKSEPIDVDSTFELVERVKGGDRDALNQLFTRFLPGLRRWASGRL